MDNNTLRSALSSRGADILKESLSTLQELTFNDLFAYLSANGLHPRENKNFFDSIGLLTKEGKFNKVAYLLSDNNNISLKVVRFNGKDKTCMSERTDYGNCSLITGCRLVINHLKSINVTRVKLTSGIRKEQKLFDPESFKEAWVNAVVHNDWMNMVPPSVFIFDDRIEILSYGSLPFGLSLEEFYSGKSVPVNETLFRIFTYSEFAEQTGHGVPTIVSKYSVNAFSISNLTITITIPLAFELKKSVEKQMMYPSLSVMRNKIINAIHNNPKVTLKELSQDIGIAVTSLWNHLDYLQKEGYIQRIGSRKSGNWIILNKKPE